MDGNLFKWLSNRHLDPDGSGKLKKLRLSTLELSDFKSIQLSGEGNVQWMEIEPFDNRYLLGGRSVGSVDIFDLDSRSAKGKQMCKVVCSSKRVDMHTGAVVCASWYPVDSGMFVTSGADDLLKIWDTNRMRPKLTLRVTAPLRQHHMSSAPGSKSSMIAVASDTSIIHMIDMRTAVDSRSLNGMLKGHKANVRFVQYSPACADLLASGGSDGHVYLWDIRCARNFLKSFITSTVGRNQDEAHKSAVVSLKFTPDGNFLISYGADGRLLIWDAIKGRLSGKDVTIGSQFAMRKNLQMDIAYDIPGAERIFVPVDQSVKVVDLQNGVDLTSLNGHFKRVNSAVYRPQYNEVYTAADDKFIRVWNPRMDNCWGRSDSVETSQSQDDWGQL